MPCMRTISSSASASRTFELSLPLQSFGGPAKSAMCSVSLSSSRFAPRQPKPKIVAVALPTSDAPSESPHPTPLLHPYPLNAMPPRTIRAPRQAFRPPSPTGKAGLRPRSQPMLSLEVFLRSTRVLRRNFASIRPTVETLRHVTTDRELEGERSGRSRSVSRTTRISTCCAAHVLKNPALSGRSVLFSVWTSEQDGLIRLPGAGVAGCLSEIYFSLQAGKKAPPILRIPLHAFNHPARRRLH